MQMLNQSKIPLIKDNKMISFNSSRFNLKTIKSILVSCFIISISTITYAQSSENLKINAMPISIDADNQQIDIQKNTMTFSGNVVIIQDNITIKANKVVITEIQSKEDQTITAYGQPVLFEQQVQKNDTHYKITGNADKLIYRVKQNDVTMQGNAQIKQKDNYINSNIINYDVQQRKIEAQSDARQRVRTIIMPEQVKEIN